MSSSDKAAHDKLRDVVGRVLDAQVLKDKFYDGPQVLNWYASHESTTTSASPAFKKVWAVYVFMDLNRMEMTEDIFKACIRELHDTPLVFLTHFMDGFMIKPNSLYGFDFVQKVLTFMGTRSQTCYVGEDCWASDVTTTLRRVELCMRSLKAATKHPSFLATTAATALKYLVEYTLAFIVRDMRATQGTVTSATSRSVVMAVRLASDIVRAKQALVDSILQDQQAGVLRNLFDALALQNQGGGAYPAGLTPMGKLAHFFLSFIRPLDKESFDMHGLGPTIQYFNDHFATNGSVEDKAAIAEHIELFKRKGWAPRIFNRIGTGSVLSKIVGSTTRALGRATSKPTKAHKLGSNRSFASQAMTYMLYGNRQGQAESISLVVDNLREQLDALRRVATEDHNEYAYRRTKVRALRNIRKNVEAMLHIREVKNVDNKSVATDRCVNLHLSRRHLFTLDTWKQAMPDIEDFVMSGDNEKPLKEVILHKKFELYALNELGHCLQKAADIAKDLLDRIRMLGRSATSADIYDVFSMVDKLYWLVQKQWQEHCLDTYYSRETLEEHGPTCQWMLQNKSLFERDDMSAKRYITDTLADIMASMEFGNGDDEYLHKLDIVAAASRDARLLKQLAEKPEYKAYLDNMSEDAEKNLLKELSIVGDDGCPIQGVVVDPLGDEDGEEDGEEDGDESDADSVFHTLQGMTLDQARNLALLLRLIGNQRKNTGLNIQQVGGAAPDDREVKRQYQISGEGNLQSPITAQRERVNRLSQMVKSTLDGAVKAMSLLPASAVTGSIKKILESPLIKLADTFYARVRLAPNYYNRANGSAASAVADVFNKEKVDGSEMFKAKGANPEKASLAIRVTLFTLVKWAMTELDVVMLYVMKVLRFLTLIFAMYAAQKIFSQHYVSQVYAEKKQAPSLTKLLLMALSIDAFLQLVITALLVVASVMLKRRENDTFVLDDAFIYLSLKEYILSTLLILVCGSIVAHIMVTKRYFNYRNDGLKVIRGFSEIMIGINFVATLVPCFRVPLIL